VSEGLEDTLKVEDVQWQVWDLANRKVVLTLPAGYPTACYPSLSSSGRFVYANRAQEMSVFSVPVATQ
jgi:hypothetical protein